MKHSISEVRTDLFDGKLFIEESKPFNQFKVNNGYMNDKLLGSIVKCYNNNGRLTWEETGWALIPFTGKICWYIGAGWHTVGIFEKGILQNRLEWVDPNGSCNSTIRKE